MDNLVHTVTPIDRIRYDDEKMEFIIIVHHDGNSLYKYKPKRLTLKCTDEAMVIRLTKRFATHVSEKPWEVSFDIHYDPHTSEIVGEPYVVEESCTIS